MSFDFSPMFATQYAIWGIAAEYYPAGKDKIACMVIEVDTQMGGFLAQSPFIIAAEKQADAKHVRVRWSEVEIAKRGDMLVILEHVKAGRTVSEASYLVREEPQPPAGGDPDKLEWDLQLKPGSR